MTVLKKINWGTRIAFIYGCFVLLIAALVYGSMRQRSDLVSKDYYEQELKYQSVIAASKNQSSLSEPVSISADDMTLTIKFPAEFTEKAIIGNVYFYSPVNEKWDRSFDLVIADNKMLVPLQKLVTTKYNVKLKWSLDGKNYYQESEIHLN
jgi:hypothetical protein